MKPHDIQVGDQVLLLQKQSKTQSRYDPQPYRVVEVQGTQITAVRGDKIRKRDSKLFKKILPGVPTNYKNIRQPLDLHGDNQDLHYGEQDLRPPQGPAGYTPPPSPPREAEERVVVAPGNMPQRAPAGGRGQRQYEYPNRHLDPNIDLNMPREARQRAPAKAYDASSGSWK